MKNTKFIGIAIDGPSGAGKSTVAKLLAKRLGYVYIDTGALYRTVGLFAQQRGVPSKDTEGIIALLPDINIEMKLVDGSGVVFLNGNRIGDEIRTPLSSVYASDVSKIPKVREFLLFLQRDVASKNNVVMDGRDIGTVILPDSTVKIFLFASDEDRARRRYIELTEKGSNVTYEEVLKDIIWRDKNDSTREVAPAVPAKEAIMVDNSGLTVDETFEKILEIVEKVLKESYSV